MWCQDMQTNWTAVLLDNERAITAWRVSWRPFGSEVSVASWPWSAPRPPAWGGEGLAPKVHGTEEGFSSSYGVAVKQAGWGPLGHGRHLRTNPPNRTWVSDTCTECLTTWLLEDHGGWGGGRRLFWGDYPWGRGEGGMSGSVTKQSPLGQCGKRRGAGCVEGGLAMLQRPSTRHKGRTGTAPLASTRGKRRGW